MKKYLNGKEVQMTSQEIVELEDLRKQCLIDNPDITNDKTINEQAPYMEQRRNDYPPIGDQLDMIWHTIDKDDELQHKFYDFYQTVKKTKVKFPKQ